MCICIWCVYTLFCLKYKKKKIYFHINIQPEECSHILWPFQIVLLLLFDALKSSKRYCYLNSYLQCGLWNLSFLNLKLKPIYCSNTMHWERGRERMREGKERKEKRKGRVVRQGERGGKGVRKDGKKKNLLVCLQWKIQGCMWFS